MKIEIDDVAAEGFLVRTRYRPLNLEKKATREWSEWKYQVAGDGFSCTNPYLYTSPAKARQRRMKGVKQLCRRSVITQYDSSNPPARYKVGVPWGSDEHKARAKSYDKWYADRLVTGYTENIYEIVPGKLVVDEK